MGLIFAHMASPFAIIFIASQRNLSLNRRWRLWCNMWLWNVKTCIYSRSSPWLISKLWKPSENISWWLILVMWWIKGIGFCIKVFVKDHLLIIILERIIRNNSWLCQGLVRWCRIILRQNSNCSISYSKLFDFPIFSQIIKSGQLLLRSHSSRRLRWLCWSIVGCFVHRRC